MKNFDLLNQFSVERVAGTKQELEARNLLKKKRKNIVRTFK